MLGSSRRSHALLFSFGEAPVADWWVHGDDFTFASLENEVPKLLEEMKGWYEIKVRAILGGSL